VAESENSPGLATRGQSTVHAILDESHSAAEEGILQQRFTQADSCNQAPVVAARFPGTKEMQPCGGLLKRFCTWLQGLRTPPQVGDYLRLASLRAYTDALIHQV
jgi:hypothetical protein